MAVIRDRYELVIDTKGADRALGGVTTALKGFVAAIAVDQVIDFGKAVVDASSRLQDVKNRLSLVTDSAAELDTTMARLTTTAMANRASFEETATLYTSLTTATESLGYSQDQVLKITTKFQQALAVSGADAGTAAGAIRQFGQAMGSGTVRGDEFNSIVEALGPALGVMARESGTTVGELREMSQAGDLTAEAFSKMLLNSDGLTEAFQNMTITTGQLEQQFGDSFTFMLAKFDEAIGLSEMYRESLSGITRTMDQFSGREGAIANIADADLMRAVTDGAISYDTALKEVYDRLAEAPYGLWHIWTDSIPEDVQNLYTMRDTIRQMKADAESAAADAKEAGVGLGENVAAPVEEAADKLDAATKRLNTQLDDFASDAAERVMRQRGELELASLTGVERAIKRIEQEEQRRLRTMESQIRASKLTKEEQDKQIENLRTITQETITSRQQVERQTNAVTQNLERQAASRKAIERTLQDLANDSQNGYIQGWTSTYEQWNRDTADAVNAAAGIWTNGTSNMLNSLDEFVRNGKFSLTGLARDVGQVFRGNLVNAAGQLLQNTQRPADQQMSGSSILGGLFQGTMNDIIGGFMGRRALGGSVMAGSAYMVGESGREMFFPNTSGTIVPDKGMGGTNINFTVNATDTVGFDSYLNKRRGDIVNLVRQAMQENRGRF